MKAQPQVSQTISNPSPTTRALPTVRSYPIILKEMIAALVARLMLAFAVVGLWLIVSPAIYLILVLVVIVFAIVGVPYFALMLVLYLPRSSAQASPVQYGFYPGKMWGFAPKTEF